MKELSSTKPYVLMMVGIPGAGKSFFAKQFSETFGAPLVSYDILNTITLRQLGSKTINEIIQHQITELYKPKRSFIIDGICASRSVRHKISLEARSAGYEALTIWVQTPEHIAEARACRRNPRKHDDIHNISLTSAEFKSLSKKLTPPMHEEYVAISGLQTYTSQAKAVLKRLSDNHRKDAHKAHKDSRQSELARTKRPASVRRSVIIR